MDPITIGLGLAKFIPDIIDMFDGDDDKASKTAAKVIGIAEKVTGHEGENALAAIERDPKLALELRKQVTNDKYFKEQLDAKDRKNARTMYQTSGHGTADSIANHIINFNLWFVIAIAVVEILVLSYFSELPSEVIVIIGNVSGWIIKGLLDERLQVTSFYFGSSLGSKHKDMKP